MVDWHRLFGITTTDRFHTTCYSVKMEADLSLKKQFLDMVISREGEGNPPQDVPDGFDNLANHNLITFKSHQQTLDGKSMDELIGHSINYRKVFSTLRGKQLSDQDIRLYAITARYPRKLLKKANSTKVCQGVFDVQWGGQIIRVIVTSAVALIPRNAIWHLFSGKSERVEYGLRHYSWQIGDLTTVINKIWKYYQIEGFPMAYTVEQYIKESRKELLSTLLPEEKSQFIAGLTPEERLKGLPPEERLKGLSREDIEGYLRQLKNK